MSSVATEWRSFVLKALRLALKELYSKPASLASIDSLTLTVEIRRLLLKVDSV